MPRTLADIFQDHPSIEVLKVVGCDDGGPWGLTSDGRELRIADANFARQLAELPHVETEAGHILEEGFLVHGRYDVIPDCYGASVRRLPRRKGALK